MICTDPGHLWLDHQFWAPRSVTKMFSSPKPPFGNMLIWGSLFFFQKATKNATQMARSPYAAVATWSGKPESEIEQEKHPDECSTHPDECKTHPGECERHPDECCTHSDECFKHPCKCKTYPHEYSVRRVPQ